jgi:nicotinate-nucleotide pyrophosphorylase (carboxylating)
MNTLLNPTLVWKSANDYGAFFRIMKHELFETFFTPKAIKRLTELIGLALAEDGPDLTSEAVFAPGDSARAEIKAKEKAVVCGLPIAGLVLERLEPGAGKGVKYLSKDGDEVEAGTVVAVLEAPARVLLKAERVILNFITHLSGVAGLTRAYVRELEGARTTLLDTRKTLPGMRYPEKYAVLTGGGENHRLDLAEMLMLKDNHIDRAGGIGPAVKRLREAYSPCPPIEVECRTPAEVDEATALGVDRIMLDNMAPEELAGALARVPAGIETEVSGGVSLENIRTIAEAGPDFVSVGRLTHSAPAADFSMKIIIGRHD